MTALKGEAVPLNDLLGFSRLQEVLVKIIGHLNEQDEKIGRVVTDSAKMQITQEQALSKMKQEVEEVVKKMDVQDRRVKDQLAEMEKKVDALPPLVKAEADARKQDAQKLFGELGLLQTSQKESKAKVEAVEKDIGHAKERIKRLQEDVERFGKVDQKIDELSGDIAKVATTAKEAGDGVKKAEEKHAALVETVQQLREALEAAKKESSEGLAAATTQIQEQLSKVEADFATADAELKAALEAKDAANQERIRKVDEAFKAFAASMNFKDQIAALQKKLMSEIQALRDELGPLQEALKNMADTGSSATVRCLSCSTKRPTNSSSFTIGTDGRTYFRTSDGNNVNLGRINLPSLGGSHHNRSISPSSRSVSPTRTKATSPLKSRSGTGLQHSVSAGHL
eukprot:TRINITY_DN91254_c0_g1_i1.p1 TRINITY_DN91254_c0_g1~~TRINITY_DN91254_c0_g1_i1.p1  ORF type:complete len:422 (+),score=125.98 TRINITY_DN91254_c0_g1_i1:78-1268(+)